MNSSEHSEDALANCELVPFHLDPKTVKLPSGRVSRQARRNLIRWATLQLRLPSLDLKAD